MALRSCRSPFALLCRDWDSIQTAVPYLQTQRLHKRPCTSDMDCTRGDCDIIYSDDDNSLGYPSGNPACGTDLLRNHPRTRQGRRLLVCLRNNGYIPVCGTAVLLWHLPDDHNPGIPYHSYRYRLFEDDNQLNRRCGSSDKRPWSPHGKSSASVLDTACGSICCSNAAQIGYADCIKAPGLYFGGNCRYYGCQLPCLTFIHLTLKAHQSNSIILLIPFLSCICIFDKCLQCRT